MRSLLDNLEQAQILPKDDLSPSIIAYSAGEEPFHQFLSRRHKLDHNQLTSKLAHDYHIPEMDENKFNVLLSPASLADESWIQFCLDHNSIPLSQHGDTLSIAMSDPFDFSMIEELENKSHKVITRFFCSKDLLARERPRIEKILKPLLNKDDHANNNEAHYRDEDAVSKVQEILDESIRQRASDIHIEPSDGDIHIRFRVDGLLQEITTIPRDMYSQIVGRVKVMANLDIAERRLPQDGAIAYSVLDKKIEFRVSTLPGVYGENIVLRLLDSASLPKTLGESGLSGDLCKRYENLIQKPYGIVLVTGPTGSGKTTTLYSTLSLVQKPSTNLITIEDPVEYRREGMHQIQINTKAGMTFANALRSILRQDPDVIMVGEMRDRETTEIAIRAALTGHLVFSTLHTNDCPSSFTRLVDMGIAPYLVGSAVLGILAQRLVRRICNDCKKPHTLSPDEHAYLTYRLKQDDRQDDLNQMHFFEGAGCDSCKNRGYRGRVAIFELMAMDPAVSQAILAGTGPDTIALAARAQGYRPIWEDAFDKVQSSDTTVEELMRVLN